MFMEIRPINLTKQIYDPMQGQAREESLSDKMRKTAERRFQRQMREYQVKKQDRDERDYILKRRAENFVFSNYPSDKAFGDFTTAGAERKFGEGSEDKYLQKWKQQVGGNFGAFQQWYQMSKAKEDAAYWKSFQRNPGKYKTEKEYEKALSNFMNNMTEDEQQRFLSSAPPEILTLIQNNWDAYDDSLFSGKNILTGAAGLATAGALAFGASKIPGLRGGLKSVGKENLDTIVSKLPKGTQELAKDFIGPGLPTNKLSQVQSSLKKMVRRNQISFNDSVKLEKVLKELADEGSAITGENIGKKLLASPTQYDSLIKGIQKSKIGSIGPLNIMGAKKYLLALGASAIGANQLLDQDLGESVITGAGVASGIDVGSRIMSTISQINQIRNQMGTEKFLSLIKRKMGRRFIGGAAMKALLGTMGGPLAMGVSGAMLAADLAAILALVQQYNSEE